MNKTGLKADLYAYLKLHKFSSKITLDISLKATIFKLNNYFTSLYNRK
jgi:hypothetical protein